MEMLQPHARKTMSVSICTSVVGIIVLGAFIVFTINMRTKYLERLQMRADAHWWQQQCQNEEFHDKLSWKCQRISHDLANESDFVCFLESFNSMLKLPDILINFWSLCGHSHFTIIVVVLVCVGIAFARESTRLCRRNRALRLRQWRPML